ncbi:MAG: DUF2207 domain-containing protein [Weeksellaceae bacterium]|jgi:effector-binding domain-containing protein/uncharacterized membrane protein YgcG|nr:DUF2207 domain-containing protein [Weeksellaceae bacterium]
MKKLIFTIVFLFSVGFCFAQGFVVKKFAADIEINQDGWFDITETYDVVFTEYKHGLLRNIITQYNLDGENHKIYISELKVPGHKFTSTPTLLEKYTGRIELKIGDKNKTIIGPQQYIISYRVKNAFLFDEQEAMFYWNLKPDGWYADFENVEISIKAPDAANLSAENSFIYSGFYGNTQVSEDFDNTFSGHTFTAKSKPGIIFRGSENITALIKLPKDLIAQHDYSPSLFAKYGWLGILGLIGFFFWHTWKKFGQDDKVISATSYYPPENIDPGMAGYLINDREDSSDLISFIPKWGHEGIIRLEEIPKKGIFSKADTRIYKLKNLPEGRPNYERTIFNGLFSHSSLSGKNIAQFIKEVQESITGTVDETTENTDSHLGSVLVSSLTNSFYVTMNKAKGQLKKQAQVYYEAKSNRIMKMSYVFSFLGLFLVSGIFLLLFNLVAALVSSLFFIFLIIMSGYMKKKNKKGSAILSELKGFRQFIKLAETNRIKTLIETDPDYFEKTMSYALAFGLLRQWSSKFSALDIPPPQWYSSPNTLGVMSMSNFTNSFSSAMASTQSAMISTPSSSGSGGGGSSGGGFGGGGGGSW